ncbi:nonmuscle myosin heavy chain b [Fomitopsis serialis]|uniref:nonmuscle myosin heavy chain b n=1 Tax=Fomitopsis serialis TaxID=139415 RepID=UPI0020077333|nr:nonmuscle myosin heavy chain b [Neoantrodia serialis]KAH9914424.1 nonmuscle myosin heavy chain b [Neoantrodia serialis]
MPVPRLSQSAEAARAAAQQAEFNEKKWVWVPDDKDGYLAGWVVKEEEDMGEVVIASGGEIRRLPLYALSKMNPPKFDRVDDIADLTFLNEASVVHNLRLRYGSGAIYTYSGLFLVAINPYQHLPLYSDAIVHQYRGKRRDENPPHIFAIAERAWINMGEERENQSILITGESGAGKTESTKKVIQYLAAIATDAHPPPSHSQSPSLTHSNSFNSIMPSSGLPRSSSFKKHGKGLSSSGSGFTSKDRLGLLERQILQANPILEAFGNAQTQRNNNSSRFGKFIRISFSPDGSIAGANIDWYLLEKSRVVVRSEAERSFHVFYQLMEGGGSLKDTLLLDGGVEDYEYLNKSRREVDGIDDKEEWALLKNALETVGFTAAEQLDLFRIVAAVLHIGNITLTETRSNDAVMPDPSQAERVCHLLGIPVAEFTRALLRPRVLAGREWVTQARTQQQALDELSALCKTLYEKSFGMLVDRINRALDRPSSKSTFIGVLDIAGFEIFDVNGYEQLLINYTNEKLQQFFNYHMFTLEQEEYAREGIEWDYVNFGLDLQPTIDLIETSGTAIGILSLLDEECIMPKATDLTFTNKLHALWASEPLPGDEPHPGSSKYEPARFEQGFIVNHYAGRVEYRTDGWLEKNKDPLNDNLTRVLAASSERYVASLFAEYSEAPSIVGALTMGKKRVTKKGAFRTVGQRHKEQLAGLMAQLQATQPHFVRCIVPNTHKKPGRVDVPLVLDQLRCNGVLEGIRIARLGYPNRLPFVEFRQRYEVLTPGVIPRGYMDGRKACLRMVDALELDKTNFRIGTSKIFFKAGVLAELEERRDALLFDIFSRLQAVARKWTARRQMKKILNRAVAVRTIQRNARVYGELRDWPWWQLYTKVRPLLAATRNDDELRKKEAELALAKERAERDQREKEALESLKMRLEADKRKVEDDLEAERALALDKDALLDRSKKREAELEEEVAALQADLDILDSQLDRALKLQKESEEKHETLRQAFDQAAEHLVRLESEQQDWESREVELNEQLDFAQEEIDAIKAERENLEKLSDELKNLVAQREEDLARTKERMESTLSDLGTKLTTESRNKDALREKADSLEEESRHAKQQLSELARTATDYSAMIKAKEEEADRLAAELDKSKVERGRLMKQISELQGKADALTAELLAQRSDRERDAAVQAKLQEELDELRSVLAAKTSEETRRSEVEKSKEQELANLRAQTSQLSQDLDDARRSAVEGQTRLKVDLDTLTREHASLEKSHRSLSEREQSARSELKVAETSLGEAVKARRTLESDLQAIRTRQIDTDGQLAEVLKEKEHLERQLTTMQSKFEDSEDVVLQLEREKGAHDRQMETVKKQLNGESAKRSQLEKSASSQKQEIARLKDMNIKLDRELNKALSDLKAREWEVKQLEARQDKTIVEHVHVLEEAKRVTDRQLQEAQQELQAREAYIRSLEKARSKFMIEAEDLVRDRESEQLQLRAKDKKIKAEEDKAIQALAALEKERRAREAAELHVKRLQNDLELSQSQVSDAAQQLASVQKAKDNLELELTRLADEGDTPNSTAKLQRQYEARIAQLEDQLQDSEMSKTTAARIKEQVDRQHAEIRRLIMSSGPKDDSFRSRLLRELELADEEMEREMSVRRHATGSDVRSLANLTPSKRSLAQTNGVPRSRKDSHPDAIRVQENRQAQVNALKQQVQILEIQMAASTRVRQYLEQSLREMTAEFENSDGSKQSLEQYRARLAKENARLAELLEDEAEARRAAEAAQLNGVQAMWDKFQATIQNERDSYSRLEESRKALVVQQRAAAVELEDQRRQVQELLTAKKQMQTEIADLKDRLEVEIVAKNGETNARRELQSRLQELEITSSTSSTVHSELQEAVETYKVKVESYIKKLEEAEISKAKIARAESHSRRALADAEKAHADAIAERNAAEERLKTAGERIRELESRLDEEGRESSDLELLRQRLAEEMEDERKHHQEELSERDFTADQTRKKYQAELAQLSEELQSQRDTMSRLREESRKIRSHYDELQLRHDEEVYNGGSWKKDKERLETKIQDLTKAYDSSTAAQAEQQSQIVSLHSQVRELRSVLNDAEADRALLQKARRALQAELEAIKFDSVDTTKMSSETELQKLRLEKQDLERSLEEQNDRVAMAFERMKKAEGYATECQVELGKTRVENSELDKLNANLEKQIKELNLRIVDLETKSLNVPRPSSTSSRRLESRIEELTNQLNQTSKDSSRLHRSADKTARDARFQLAEAERQRQRLEEEVRSYEGKITSMRQAMDELQTSENSLQLAKRRAERENGDLRQQSLNLEREVERLRSRLERPASSVMMSSPVSSPRK